MSDESRFPPYCRRMRDALRQKGWQQDVVAAIMGMSLSTVNAALTGRRKLTARDAVGYGEILAISPRQLLHEQDAWLLSLLPHDEAKTATIKRRAAIVDARIAADVPTEIARLEEERDAINTRITILKTT